MYSPPHLYRTDSYSTIDVDESIPIGVSTSILTPSDLEFAACAFGGYRDPMSTQNTSTRRLPAYPMHTRLSSIHPAIRPVHPALRDLAPPATPPACSWITRPVGTGKPMGMSFGETLGAGGVTTTTCTADPASSRASSAPRRGIMKKSKNPTPSAIPIPTSSAAVKNSRSALKRLMCLHAPRRGRKLVKRDLRVRIEEQNRVSEIEGFLEGGRGGPVGNGTPGMMASRVRWAIDE